MNMDQHWALCDDQDPIDARLRHMGFTGPSYYPPTNDWQAWLNGRVIGWKATKAEAQTFIYEQQTRDLKQVA